MHFLTDEITRYGRDAPRQEADAAGILLPAASGSTGTGG
jgi:hypothetical protein